MTSNILTLKGTKAYLLVLAIVLPLLIASIILFVFLRQDSSRTNLVNQNDSILGVSEFSQPESFYNYAYGEIFAAYRSGMNIKVEVFNTTGVEDYSPTKWEQLDENAIAEELGVTRVRINHPQYWVVDSVVGLEVEEEDFVIKVEDINLQKVNEVETSIFDGGFSNSPYSENNFISNTELTWNAGTEVYELISLSGDVYRMRSYSQSIESSLEINNLNILDEKLDLPSGWEFSSYKLESEFTFSGEEMTLIADDLGNSYILIN